MVAVAAEGQVHAVGLAPVDESTGDDAPAVRRRLRALDLAGRVEQPLRIEPLLPGVLPGDAEVRRDPAISIDVGGKVGRRIEDQAVQERNHRLALSLWQRLVAGGGGLCLAAVPANDRL